MSQENRSPDELSSEFVYVAIKQDLERLSEVDRPAYVYSVWRNWADAVDAISTLKDQHCTLRIAHEELKTRCQTWMMLFWGAWLILMLDVFFSILQVKC